MTYIGSNEKYRVSCPNRNENSELSPTTTTPPQPDTMKQARPPSCAECQLYPASCPPSCDARRVVFRYVVLLLPVGFTLDHQHVCGHRVGLFR